MSVKRKTNLIVVLKIGTSSLIHPDNNCPYISNIAKIVETVVDLKKDGVKVIIVSSGAIGVGLKRMKLSSRPKKLSEVQALAAIGQGRLMSLWDDMFSQVNQPTAQILLTRNDISKRNNYLSACNTMIELLNMDVIPIVNENDTVSTDEIRFGDNDTLSALGTSFCYIFPDVVAGMVKAQYLIIMSDVDALYSCNPRTHPEAVPLREVQNVDEIANSVSVDELGSAYGTGGMKTKLSAAALATSAGCNCVITSSMYPERIQGERMYVDLDVDNIDIMRGNRTYGTVFLAKDCPMGDRKWWIQHGLRKVAKFHIDDGAKNAIKNKHSLLPSGIIRIEGDSDFLAHQCVVVLHNDKEVAFGLCNYSRFEAERIIGRRTSDIQDILGYCDHDSVIHRDNLVLIENL